LDAGSAIRRIMRGRFRHPLQMPWLRGIGRLVLKRAESGVRGDAALQQNQRLSDTIALEYMIAAPADAGGAVRDVQILSCVSRFVTAASGCFDERSANVS
jgi:hypothetical protein